MDVNRSVLFAGAMSLPIASTMEFDPYSPLIVTFCRTPSIPPLHVAFPILTTTAVRVPDGLGAVGSPQVHLIIIHRDRKQSLLTSTVQIGERVFNT